LGKCVMGRQVAYMIYSHFQTNPNMDFSYGIADLTAMQWHGDHSISTFIFLWRQIVSRMKTQLPEEMLMDTLFGKMEASTVMVHDLAHFNRMDEGHPDRSYAYLMKCMDKAIGLQRQQANRDAQTKASKAGNAGGAKSAPAINSTEGLSKAAKKKADKAAKALAAASGGAVAPGKGKGKGKPDAAASGERTIPICWFHNFGGCTKSAANCTHQHKKVSKEAAELLYRPPGAVPKVKSAPAIPAAPAPPGPPPAKAKAESKAKPAPQNLNWCKAYLSEKGCPNSAADCTYPHLEDASVKNIREKQAKAKAKAKAKAAEG
jgi:hypothetical protein